MDELPVDLIPLMDVPKYLPTRPHASSVFRWMDRGCRGVKLPVVRIGGKTMVSRRALLDFIAAVSTRRRNEPPSSPPPATPARSARRDAAKRRLDAAGVR